MCSSDLSHHKFHSSMITLSIWSKLTYSTCIPSNSHPKVLDLAVYSSSFHIGSVVFPSMEINGPPYPLIHLPSDETNYNIPFSLRLNFWNITMNQLQLLLKVCTFSFNVLFLDCKCMFIFLMCLASPL